ncbi:hypothetical protein AAFF_G00192120 [Aldrovandia affinis]|uniref:Uncharacterized protein n=1 Tax=Aldrovandia affinis TaxID=143900 RepID=A0AAD7RLU4_9TELE|nr:hypothetical protein AAFF_G00192120 [Aldrovandia affinis]
MSYLYPLNGASRVGLVSREVSRIGPVSGRRLCSDMEALSVDSAFASWTEDEGPFDSTLEHSNTPPLSKFLFILEDRYHLAAAVPGLPAP